MAISGEYLFRNLYAQFALKKNNIDPIKGIDLSQSQYVVDSENKRVSVILVGTDKNTFTKIYDLKSHETPDTAQMVDHLAQAFIARDEAHLVSLLNDSSITPEKKEKVVEILNNLNPKDLQRFDLNPSQIKTLFQLIDLGELKKTTLLDLYAIDKGSFVAKLSELRKFDQTFLSQFVVENPAAHVFKLLNLVDFRRLKIDTGRLEKLETIIELSDLDARKFLRLNHEELLKIKNEFEINPEATLGKILDQVILKLLVKKDVLEDLDHVKLLLPLINLSDMNLEQTRIFSSWLSKNEHYDLLDYTQARQLQSLVNKFNLKFDEEILTNARFRRAVEITNNPKSLNYDDLPLFGEFFKVLSVHIKDMKNRDDSLKFSKFFKELSPSQQQLLREWGNSTEDQTHIVTHLFADVNEVSQDDYKKIKSYIKRYDETK